ncbi:MAG: hypothetical protein ACM3NH_01605 [Candidatus Saccharibacteria bacterium]
MRLIALLAVALCLIAGDYSTAQSRLKVSYRYSMRTVRSLFRKPQPMPVPAYAPIPDHRGRRIDHRLVYATAYCPCTICCEKMPHDKAYGITAKGKNAFIPNGVAADFSLLPAGTKISIPGIGLRVVDDSGRDMRIAAKRGIYHIDIRMKNHSQAVRFGHHWIQVAIIR